MNTKQRITVTIGIAATLLTFVYLPCDGDGPIVPGFSYISLFKLREASANDTTIVWLGLGVEIVTVWLWTMSAWFDFRRTTRSVVLKWSVFLTLFGFLIGDAALSRRGDAILVWLLAFMGGLFKFSVTDISSPTTKSGFRT